MVKTFGSFVSKPQIFRLDSQLLVQKVDFDRLFGRFAILGSGKLMLVCLLAFAAAECYLNDPLYSLKGSPPGSEGATRYNAAMQLLKFAKT